MDKETANGMAGKEACRRLILRDELALERTVMANHRTFLAYIRTALALLLAGVSFIHFANRAWFAVIGYISLVLGAVTVMIGIVQSARVGRFIWTVRSTGWKDSGDTD